MIEEVEVAHVGGLPWHEAPRPRRWHFCRPQTFGWIGFDQVDRCACGASRANGGRWVRRNSRRRDATRR
jgi:hypothetical protein